MNIKLKRLAEQTVVITGASSGIGLVTARLAAARGAALVLAARREDALKELTDELTASGARAVYVVADVGVEDDVRRIADAARASFGGFDTWVNNAGVGIYGELLEVTPDDHRRLFETNFWGVVYGSFEAARQLREHGGALINVGSALSDRAIPLQGMYATSKHAVKGFTEALRIELEAAGAPVSVTLVKPASIDTPFPQNAKNYLSEEPTLPPPVYAPDLVAEAILHAAETPGRDVIVGGGGKLISAAGRYAPRLTDKLMETRGFYEQQRSGMPVQYPTGSTATLDERGLYGGHVRTSSVYTKASRHPVLSLLAVAAGVAAVALLVGGDSDREQRRAAGSSGRSSDGGP